MPTRGDVVLQARVAASISEEVDHAAPALAEQFCDRADVLVNDVNGGPFDRLQPLPVLAGLEDHLRAADLKLEALAAHRLDQHREMQLTPPADAEDIRLGGIFHPQGDVGRQFTVEPAPQLAGGHELALPAGARVRC